MARNCLSAVVGASLNWKVTFLGVTLSDIVLSQIKLYTGMPIAESRKGSQNKANGQFIEVFKSRNFSLLLLFWSGWADVDGLTSYCWMFQFEELTLLGMNAPDRGGCESKCSSIDTFSHKKEGSSRGS